MVAENTFDEPEKVPGAPETEPDMVDDCRPPKFIFSKEIYVKT